MKMLKNSMIKKLMILFIPVVMLFIQSCSMPKITGKTPAEKLYNEAKWLVSDKRYLAATEKLNLLKSQYPYSYYTKEADLLLADIAYSQENFEEAAASYLLFKDLHPKHPRMDYVLFRIAESYYAQKPSTFDRDLSIAEQSVKYFQELRNNYPNSSYLAEASDKIKELDKMQKDKAVFIADFYFRTEKYYSAKGRYKSLIKRFPKDSNVIKNAKLKIIESNHELEEWRKCLANIKKYAPSMELASDIKTLEFWTDECEAGLNGDLADLAEVD